jgi:hypothetical protein
VVLRIGHGAIDHRDQRGDEGAAIGRGQFQ